MRSFNRVIELNTQQQWVTVESGITWRDLQQVIDKENLSVKIMQSYANFTVSGSLSVNVHGRYIGEGPLVRSVISLTLILADGTVVTVSPTEHSELFYGVIGGYGGLAVIAQATLKLVPNVKVERQTQTMALSQYANHFKQTIRDNPDVVFHNADIYPPNFNDVRSISWLQSDKALTQPQHLIAKGKQYPWQPNVANFVADYDIGKWARQHIIDPYLYDEEAVYWRNFEASYDVNELEPTDRQTETYALREYFVPVANFDSFSQKVADIFNSHQVNVINISVRHALPDPGTLLAWAPQEVFAFVVYYRQGSDLASQAHVNTWSKAMTDAVISEDGRYYLPYQLHATSAQFNQAYPRAEQYFALKETIDPSNRFTNALWQRHYPRNRELFATEKSHIANYSRHEGQTLLSIPQWYLTFDSLEYSNFIANSNSPSDFPFMASIEEYWRLYDQVLNLSDGQYLRNKQTLKMLKLRGITTTIEYMYKGAYENTIGRLTRWIANGERTIEDRIISSAYRAYSEHTLAQTSTHFDYATWLSMIWTEPQFNGDNFIRKLERKLLLSVEFGCKYLYALANTLFSDNNSADSEYHSYMTVRSNVDLTKNTIDGVSILVKKEHHYLIAMPRKNGFSERVSTLARAGITFVEISGNDSITLSFITNKHRAFSPSLGRFLFESNLASQPEAKRVVYQVPVTDLTKLLNQLDRNGHQVEHIYNY